MEETKYWWVRIFAFIDDLNSNETIPIEEFYIIAPTLEICKQQILQDKNIKLQNYGKPKKTRDNYVKIMPSESYYYNRYMKSISPFNDFCYMCNKEISGKFDDYKYKSTYLANYNEFEATSEDKYRYFCSHDCKQNYYEKRKVESSGVENWQDRTSYAGILGYIYHIYNKATHKHYIGQTKYLPFFRWQEHIKQGEKGELSDLVFETITTVYENKSDISLTAVEAFYINKYIEKFGKENVVNSSVPKFNFDKLEEQYQALINNKEILKQQEFKI